MEESLSLLLAQVQQQSGLEIVAVIASMAYPILAARQNILCWLCALIGTSLYTWIFWHESLPFNSLLNAYYLVMAIYGWYLWNRHSDQQDLKVTKWPLLYHIIAISCLFVSGFLLSLLVTFSWTGISLYLDAMVTVFSLYATYLMVNKVLDNWLFWLGINLVAAYLFFTHGLVLTALLYIGYFCAAIYGYFQWKKAFDDQGDQVKVT